MAKHLVGCALWSLAMPDTVESLKKAAEIGFEGVHFVFQQDSDLEPAALKKIAETLKSTGLKVPGGKVGFAGEDWTSIATIRKTGGVVDPATFPERLDRCRKFAAGYAKLGIRHATTHVGFVPEPGDPKYRGVLDRIGQIAEAFKQEGMTMGMETGQESAEVLVQAMKDLGRKDVTVNFDPANFILYGSDDPVRAARRLGPLTSMAHMKDGIASAKPREVWGVEPQLGKGQVDLKGVLAGLEEGGFKGPLLIEREAGPTRFADLAESRKLVLGLIAG